MSEIASPTALAVGAHRLLLVRRGTGPSLVYLHDEISSNWNEFLDRLAEDHAVHALELPGFGSSIRPADIEDVDDLAFLIADALEALGTEPLVLVGASLGGWLAMEAAVRTRANVTSLVLLGSPGLQIREHSPADPFFLTDDERADLFFNDPTILSSVSDEEAVRNSIMTARLVWQPRYVSPKLSRRLHRLQGKALVVWGEDDRFLDSNYGRRVAALLNGKYEAIPGSGHFPALEAPDRTAEIVAAFVRANQTEVS